MEEVEPRNGVDIRRCASKDAGPKGVDCEIPHRLEKKMSASCHGHACPGHVAHGRMPMTSQTLVMSFHSSVFPFVILERMIPQKYHV